MRSHNEVQTPVTCWQKCLSESKIKRWESNCHDSSRSWGSCHQRSRNGPARQRRRQRRAEALDAAVVVAEQVNEASNVTEEVPAGEAENEIEVNNESETIEAENAVFNLKD